MHTVTSVAASSGLFRAHLVDMIYVEVNSMGYTVILEQEPDGGYVVHAPAFVGGLDTCRRRL
ncbi:MAG: hypothetical protein WBE26_18480 [Phycisphaerae bacterium]